ncbi:thiamine pyrophosphate-binding enzyme family protein [Tieghemostelium lacteum]|uniref:Thiamine pyrophosphate-binding enzyme family protein n=1 Tax=Tieghemostelium lacteum TaxID=361077 RepID=A0A152A437_TIELA|nr:thiamine pyrophosphate-binding enzyme family protein [Tieghemostelium lacteum]|eukprot:KYR00996.1 thiamine pyrophosphate-binding enzyme family protein [Tieghemostelium lacteum]
MDSLVKNIHNQQIIAASAAVALGGGFALLKYFYENRIVTGSNKELFYFNQQNATGGDLVAKVLSSHGVKFIFTLTGGHISPILISCDKENIRVIDVRHEVTAVFAADAVSRLSGVPGVAAVTAGPGLTNTITAVKNAQMAQSALVLIGGATSDLLKGRGSLQDIDQFALLKPHVKWMKHISKVSEIVPTLEMAFAISKQGTPGPVFVEFPIDTLYPQPITSSWYLKAKYSAPTLASKIMNFYINRHLHQIFGDVLNRQIQIHNPSVFSQMSPNNSNLESVLYLLIKAKRPVLIVGSQAVLLSGANGITAEQIQKSVQGLGVPTFTSSMSRGLLGAQHPILFRHCRSYALQHADLVILAGVVCDFRLNYGKTISSKAKLVSINRDKVDLYKNRSPNYAYHSDPAQFLIGLYKIYQEQKPTSLDQTWKNWVDDLNSRDIEKNLEISKKIEIPPTKEGFINPLKALKLFDHSLPSQTVLVADGGDFVASASYIVCPRGPLSWLDPGVFGTLGVGAGFALGAKLVNPHSQVWIIFGDGACGYSIPEYDTFVRHKIAIGALVGNDACWMQIMREQVEYLHSEVGCNLTYTNYDQVVKAFGGEGYRVHNEQQLQEALDNSQQILKENIKPVLINCIIDRTDFRKGSISV